MYLYIYFLFIYVYNMIVKNEGCSTVNERKCIYTWRCPSLLFNFDRRMIETHVYDDECCKQCLFKLDPEQIQVEIRLFSE